MDTNKLSQILESVENEYIGFLVDICNIESPTEYKAGVDAVGKYIIEKAEKRNWKVEIQKQEVAGDAICITMHPESKERPV